MLRALLVVVLVSSVVVEHRSRADEPATGAHSPGCERISGARFALGGTVPSTLRQITAQWLLPAPAANPAILAMFRDRDRRPYRDLLPWSGEFAGKYLTGATAVLRLTGDPELKRHL